jgi:hypothetical protein
VAAPLADHLTSEAVEPKLISLLDPATATAAAALPPAALKAEAGEKDGADAKMEEEEGGEKKTSEDAGEKREEGEKDEGDKKEDKEKEEGMDVDGEGKKADGEAGDGATAAAAKPAASPLRAGAAGAGELPREASAGFHAVQLVAELARLRRGWLAGRPALFEVLLKRWDDPARRRRLTQEGELPLVQLMETRWLAKTILSCVDANRGEYAALLGLFDVYEVSFWWWGGRLLFLLARTLFQTAFRVPGRLRGGPTPNTYSHLRHLIAPPDAQPPTARPSPPWTSPFCLATRPTWSPRSGPWSSGAGSSTPGSTALPVRGAGTRIPIPARAPAAAAAVGFSRPCNNQN